MFSLYIRFCVVFEMRQILLEPTHVEHCIGLFVLPEKFRNTDMSEDKRPSQTVTRLWYFGKDLNVENNVGIPNNTSFRQKKSRCTEKICLGNSSPSMFGCSNSFLTIFEEVILIGCAQWIMRIMTSDGNRFFNIVPAIYLKLERYCDIFEANEDCRYTTT